MNDAPSPPPVEEPPPARHTPKPSGCAYVGLALLVVGSLVGAAALGVRRYRAREARIAAARPESGPKRVRVVSPKPAPSTVTASLPGTVRPRDSATVFARTSGIVRTLAADLGDRVERGAALAGIEAREVNAQVGVARARLGEAEATAPLASSKLARSEDLVKGGAGTLDDLEAAQLRATAARAAIAAGRSELARLEALAGYQRVEAPFGGTITRRWVDPGAVVSAERTPLFELATTDALVVEVDVPQALASGVKPGLAAKLAPPGGAELTVLVTRTAGALDPTTRALRVELDVPAGAKLLPNAYVTARLELPRPIPALRVPGSALGRGASGLYLFVVEADGTLRRKPARLVQDLGRDVDVTAEGVTPASRVLLVASADAEDGQLVEALPLDPPPSASGAPAGSR